MNIQTVTFNKISFVNVTSPGELELKYLKTNFGFDTLHLEDYLNKTQVPKVEVFKNYSLLVLDFPYFPPTAAQVTSTKDKDKKSKRTLESILAIPQATLSSVPIPQFLTSEKTRRLLSSQVDFFIGKDFLVVLHDGSQPVITDIFSYCQKSLHNRNEYMGQGSVFLAYRIIDVLVDSYFPIINNIYSMIDRIDKELEYTKSQSTLEDISLTRRNAVVFHTMLKPIIPLFKQLEEGKYPELNGAMQPFWSNVLDHLQKLWERLEDARELIEGISESNESLLASKTNKIVTLLTIFSAIILPLNLIASMYGMNIRLPLAEDPYAFFILLVTMVSIAFFMLIVFKVRRWF